MIWIHKRSLFPIFPAKVRLEPTLVEFAQFCDVTFKGLGTNDCIDLKIWHKPFKHKENRRGASFFMQILLSLLNIIDLACKPKKH